MIPRPTYTAGVTEGKTLAVLIDIGASEGIADPPARRQLEVQKLPLTQKGDACRGEAFTMRAFDGVDCLLNGYPPKPRNAWMAPHPCTAIRKNGLVRCRV